MNREHIKYAIIGIAIILSAYLLGRAYTYKYRSQDTVVVTGLGETEFESDLIVWSGVLTAEAAEAADGYRRIEQSKRKVSDYLAAKGIDAKQVVWNFVNVDKTYQTVYSANGNYAGQRFTGYSLRQEFSIESTDVDLVENVPREISALIAQGAPAAGCVLLAATAVWWYFAGRLGNAAANATFAVPLAGAVGGNQLAPVVAGFFLPPARALGTTAFALLVAALLASFGSGNLLGWDAFARWDFAGTDVQANLGALLLQPATWCVAVSWLAAAAVLSACRCRLSRILAVLGIVLVAAALVAGICAAAWLASGQLTWMPSVAAIVSTAVAVAVLVVASHLEPPALDLQEEWEEAASSEG